MKRNSFTVLMILFLFACPASAYIEFNDGQIHNIDYQIEDDFKVDYKTPGMHTTVNWLAGGFSHSCFHSGHENSMINILGGEIIGGLYVCDSSQLNISGGSILPIYYDSGVMAGGWLSTCNTSQANISGGYIQTLRSKDYSQINISGGEIPDFGSLDYS